jgi:hypothetical protein
MVLKGDIKVLEYREKEDYVRDKCIYPSAKQYKAHARVLKRKAQRGCPMCARNPEGVFASYVDRHVATCCGGSREGDAWSFHRTANSSHTSFLTAAAQPGPATMDMKCRALMCLISVT